MKPILFATPETKKWAKEIADALLIPQGQVVLRRFPDQESYVRVLAEVANKDILLLCRLHEPDEKMMALYFLSKKLKEMGANKLSLIVPYMPYMRQDKEFNSGEAVTSAYFAAFISSVADELITIDPHLHRIPAMSNIYSISCAVLHTSQLISNYIRKHIENPILIGPDSESAQWVSDIAKNAGVPYVISQKDRHGDRDVTVTLPHLENNRNHTPVLVDDIISTGKTMMATLTQLKAMNYRSPICIATHGIFSGLAHQDLIAAGASDIVTCNTIPHVSNRIDVTPILLDHIQQRFRL